MTESKEVVLGFIDVVNTTVNCAITGNPVSLEKEKKKGHLLSSLCRVGQLTKNKSPIPFYCMKKRRNISVAAYSNADLKDSVALELMRL